MENTNLNNVFFYSLVEVSLPECEKYPVFQSILQIARLMSWNLIVMKWNSLFHPFISTILIKIWYYCVFYCRIYNFWTLTVFIMYWADTQFGNLRANPASYYQMEDEKLIFEGNVGLVNWFPVRLSPNHPFHEDDKL